MDNMENQQIPQEETQQPEQTQTAEQPEETIQETPGTEKPQEEPVKKSRKKINWKKTGKTALICLLIAALAAGCSFAAAMFAARDVNQQWAASEKRNQQLIHQLTQKVDELEQEIQDHSYTGNGNSISGTDNSGTDGGLTPGQVYAQNVQSVVAISSQQTTTNIYGEVSQTASSGSGFILTEDGYIVTNYHVIDNATKLTVILHDATEYEAVYVGGSSSNDVAVLKINAQGLTPVKLGSSDDLIVGDQVAAIGNPLSELTSTLTVGYISAKDRAINSDGSTLNMLQTDAAINSGNSGGPLFNMKGEVIGITTAKYSGTSNSGASIEGIGFAIPIDDVLRIITDLRDYGYITGAYLGVMVQDMDPSVAEYLNIPLGVYVVDVTDGYCAKNAGVQAKDLIIGLGDYEVTCMNDLTRALQNFNGGDITTITVWRGGRELTLKIVLDNKPNS